MHWLQCRRSTAERLGQLPKVKINSVNLPPQGK